MKNLRHPAKPLYRKQLDLNVTIVSNEDSEKKDHHTHTLLKYFEIPVVRITVSTSQREIIVLDSNKHQEITHWGCFYPKSKKLKYVT